MKELLLKLAWDLRGNDCSLRGKGRSTVYLTSRVPKEGASPQFEEDYAEDVKFVDSGLREVFTLRNPPGELPEVERRLSEFVTRWDITS